MSQGAKMGLFGSKDENNESTSDDKKVCTKSKENSPDRYAPYSIDSDSETYDTEALSIMDINDIIGVQADTPGDSTLESEFAALSEIITDSKDEISLEMGNSAVGNESACKSGEAQQTKNSNNSTKEAGITSISKSLQLIGESYISDDSQETDTEDEAQSSSKKLSSFRESLGLPTNLEENEKFMKKCPSEEIAISAVDNFEREQIIAKVAKDDVERETKDMEITEKISKASEATKIEKSLDFTDSAGSNDTKKPSDDETKCMEVDLTPTSKILEKLPIENQTFEKPEESKKNNEKNVNDTEKKFRIVEVENPAIEPAEAEEPMEIDEIVTVPEVELPINAEDHTENAPTASVSIEMEKSTIINKLVDSKSEEIGKSLDKDSEIFLEGSSAPKTSEEEPTLTIREEKAPKTLESGPKCSNNRENEKISTGNKFDMETDEPPKESVVEKSEIRSEVIEQSIVEKIHEKSTNDDEIILPVEKAKIEIEKSPRNLEKVDKIFKDDSLVEREEIIERMEIDENVEPTDSEEIEPKVSKSSAKNVETVSKILSKQETNNEGVQKSRKLASKSSEILATVEKKSLPVSTSKENPNEKSAPIEAETFEKSSDIVQVLPVESFEDISLKESSRQADEDSDDEKMEVDGSAKRQNKNKSNIFEDGSSREVEKILSSVVREKMGNENMKEKSGIDTVDDTAILPVSPEVAQIEEIFEKSDDVPIKMSAETHEIVAEETSAEELPGLVTSGEELSVQVTSGTIEQGNEEKKNDEPESKAESLIQDEIAEISTEESRELKDMEMLDEVMEKEEEKESIISTRDSQSLIEVEEEIEGFEKSDLSEMSEKKNEKEMSEKMEDEKDEAEPKMANKGKEILSFTEKAESSDKIREIKDAHLEDIADSTEIEKMDESEITEVSISNEEAEPPTEESHEVEDTKLFREIIKIESLSEQETETLISTENIELANNEEEESLTLTGNIESLIEEEKEIRILTESLESSNEKTKETSIFIEAIKASSEDENQTLLSTGNVESSNEKETEISIFIGKIESSNEEEKQTLISTGNVEYSNEDKNLSLISSEKVESSIEKLEEIESAKSLEEIEESPENKKNEANEEKESSKLLRDPTNYKSKIESSIDKEKVIFSKPEVPELSRQSDIKIEEDQVDEEMSLSLEEEIHESPQSPSEDNQTSELSLERIMTEPEDDMEDHIEMNLSLDPEEKDEICPDESSNDKPEETDEEKSGQDSSENLKNILSTQSVNLTEMFNDDEQSQSTQEMMESILETDKGNINKILDDEEAESAEMDEMAKKLPNPTDELLSKDLDDPMTSQNIDSLEGLLDLDLSPENDETSLKAVQPIVEKVMNENEDIETLGKEMDVSLLMEENDRNDEIDQSDDFNTGSVENDETSLKAVQPIVEKVMNENEDIETLGKEMDVSLLMEENDRNDEIDQSEDFNTGSVEKIMANDSEEIVETCDDLVDKTVIRENSNVQLDETSGLTENDLEAFDLASVVADPLESVDTSEQTKIDLAEDLLREIDVDEEAKMELEENLLLSSGIRDEDLLLPSTSIQSPRKIVLREEVFLGDPVVTEANLELPEDISLSVTVNDQTLRDVAVEIEDLAPTSEISELESAVKFLQESEEQDIDSPLVLSPKLDIDIVVDDIARNSDVGIFSTDSDICEDASELVAELESIIPDPIAISEAEIINEAAKLESERKTKLSEETKLQSPILTKNQPVEDILKSTPPIREIIESSEASKYPETPKTHRESREIIFKPTEIVKIEHEPLKKSIPIPKISILEERLKIPPKIEIPQGEVSRICDIPTTPKTSLLIQRDTKMSNFQKLLDSPKSSEKSELKIVDTSRKDSEKYDFENVGSPRIILKIAKSAIADCSEPRSPKSPKIRSATNSPNPEDSPGQKLGKIKLKLSKGGHPSIIPNDNIEEFCGQWHTEGSSSLSPLGMKIKFSKIAEFSPIAQTDKHEDDSREQPKHKFEEAKRTESPIGMKIKFSRTGDPSIVQQDTKENTTKHKEKIDIIQQGSPKRTESPIGMKIKLSKSGDASIIQPDKQESIEDHKDGNSRSKEKLEISQQHSERNDTPRRTESPLGMKFKLFKTGDASIVQSEASEDSQQENMTKRTDSPLGMKIKLSKSRCSASIVSTDINEDTKEKLEIPELPRRTESPLGMKIKLSKTGDASIIHSEEPRESIKQKPEVPPQETIQSEGSLGVKIKVGKSGDATIVQPEVGREIEPTAHKRHDPTIGMKIKLSKSGDASIVHPERDESIDESRGKFDNSCENIRKIDSSIGMKIKLSKTGDASIIQHQGSKKCDEKMVDIQKMENPHPIETTIAAMKIKLQKSTESSIIESEKKEKSSRRKETEMPLEMKIKLSKTGHPTIVACENYGETSQRGKEICSESLTSKHKELPKDNIGMKILKSMHGASLHRSELTIEPIQSRKSEIVDESTAKRKEITISPIETKKTKLEAKLSHILPEVTIQPIKPREQKQMMFDPKKGSISRQQMNVISQEISITQVRSSKPIDLSTNDKFKSILAKKSNPRTDCEIIEHRPELIIVNENSNSSQDVMIIEEVPAIRGPDMKIPKKRGRPRRNPLPLILAKPIQQPIETVEPILQRDPLALDDVAQMPPIMVGPNFPPKENETRGRPKRTCRSQKSYAPPRRGRRRGGGRGKRKMDMEMELTKRPRIDEDLDMTERSASSLITIHEQPSEISHSTSELYKALRQPTMDRQMPNAMARVEVEQAVNNPLNDPDQMTKDHLASLMDARLKSHLDAVIGKSIEKSTNDETLENVEKSKLDDKFSSENEIFVNSILDDVQKSDQSTVDDKIIEKVIDDGKDNKDSSNPNDHENWLTPSSKKQLDGRNEGNMSNVQAIDEETRMSAESGSRSQTPAKNLSVQASETIVNEESQGSVLSTATTESEKVKVKIRRMEICMDPDDGPFTVDKIAEYEWPIDPTKKSESFMIQEQISQFLGVKSFKRKYPDLKRRMVDMEERNFLRENGLVSEAMCDMGLTAVSSSEVLDVMCSDFPDQYEEYRKYIREKQMKEHSKKQKELTAAANAEKNRIDLAEMAVQSALSWNVGLNKARKESRKCSLDLQTFTIHVPKKQQKIEEDDRANHYPVALIPGQYTDYYREYTPAELRYYPLNTVLYGPMKPNERKFDSQSEGSQSDSDSDSSSDDSSSSSSEGTQDTEASQSTMDDVDVELSRQKEDIKTIKCKMCLKHLNKFSRTEVLIQCGTCNGYVHPSCIDLTLDMVPHIQAYAWQCTDCKTCAQCHDPADEDKMLFCDMCDRGYHIYCVGLRRVPQGRWHCQECAVCASCGSREAGGANSDRNSVAQWQHEYKKGDKNTRVYVSTLCVPCSKLCGDQGSDNRQEKLSV